MPSLPSGVWATLPRALYRFKQLVREAGITTDVLAHRPGAGQFTHQNRRDPAPCLSGPGWSPPSLASAEAFARSFSSECFSSGRPHAIGPRHPRTYCSPRSQTPLQEISIGIWAHDSEEPSICSGCSSRISHPSLLVGEHSPAYHLRSTLLSAPGLVASAVILSAAWAFR